MTGRLLSIKRWFSMLQGKSVFHMRQQEGLYYEKGRVRGYYSDLRHKVSGTQLIDENGIPYNQTNRGNFVYFPITIFQYGLGLYDLYLETRDTAYRERFLKIVKWTVDNQKPDGSWNAFGWQKPDRPYSSMAQSEGMSILCRAFLEGQGNEYLYKAERAATFMLKPVENGGCSRYNGEIITLEESMVTKTILNGMIFSIWGLYDVCLLSKNEILKKALNKSVKSLEAILAKYDRRYWSSYDLDGHIASPFYHDLHIEQLKVMYKLFGNERFKQTQEKWEQYQRNWLLGRYAFIVKAIQKIKSIDGDIILVK